MVMKRFLVSAAVFLSLALGYTENSVAQSTATPSVVGALYTSGCTPSTATPCFKQYDATTPLPVSGTFSATLGGFTPAAGATAALSVTSTSSDVALPAGADVVVTNTGTKTAYVRMQAGAGTAVTTDLPIVAGAAAGFHITTATHISAISSGSDTTTLQIQGGAGLVTGYGGGSSSGGGSGGDVNITAVNGTTALANTGATGAGSLRTTVARDSTTIAGAAPGTAGSAGSSVVTVQGIASMTPVQVSQATASNLNATVVGAGTAGSPSGGVVSIQGVASGTAIPITDGAGALNVIVDSSALPSGAATSALQPTNSAQGATTSGQTGHLMMGAVTTSSPSYTTAQTNALSLDTSGNLRVNVVTGASSGAVAQGSTTSGQTVVPAGCATTTSAPTNTTAQTNMLNCSTDGSLRVNVTSATGVAQAASISGLTLSPTACQNLTSNPAAYTTAQVNIPTCDVYGGQVVQPYALSAGLVKGTTSAMTGTTSTSLIAAPGAGLKNYITSLSCVNSHATVGTFVTVQDGSGGTAIWTVAAAALFGGTVVTFPSPLQQPTANTALYVANVTTGANVICSASGFKAP